MDRADDGNPSQVCVVPARKRGRNETAFAALTEALDIFQEHPALVGGAPGPLCPVYGEEQVLKLFQSGILSDAQATTLASVVKNLATESTTERQATERSETAVSDRVGDKTLEGDGDVQ